MPTRENSKNGDRHPPVEILLVILLPLLLLTIIVVLVRGRSHKVQQARLSTTHVRPDLATSVDPEGLFPEILEVNVQDFQVPPEVRAEAADTCEEQIPPPISYEEPFQTAGLLEQQDGESAVLTTGASEEGSKVDLEVGATVVDVDESSALEQVLEKPSLEASQESPPEIHESQAEDESDTGTAGADNFQSFSESLETLDPFQTPLVQYPANEDTEVPSPKKEDQRGPRRYKPPVPTPPSRRQKPTSSKKCSVAEDSDKRSLPIAIRAQFQRGGYVRISLLLGRPSQLSEELDVTLTDQPITLTALVDEWFQDVMPDFIPEDLAQLLQNGIAWEAATDDGKLLSWSLSGRDVYILAPSNSLSGFISVTRLLIGEEHVVLCTQALLEQVLAVVDETGSPSPEVLTSGQGVPTGWVCLRRVIPQRAIPQTEGQDILNILRPLPDLDLVFVGGIRLEYSVWLADHPPMIQLRGDLSTVDTVVIDDKDALATTAGAFSSAGWDRPGDHIVWAGGRSWSYSIREVSDEWDVWEAYSFPVQLNEEVANRRLALCGPILLEPDKEEKFCSLHPMIVPASNPVLVGAVPGQIYFLPSKPNEESIVLGGYVPFQPIWALPADPYHSDKTLVKVLLVAEGKPAHRLKKPQMFRQVNSKMARDWANIVLAAGRKGLAVEPASATSKALWNSYRRQAKAVWRASR